MPWSSRWRRFRQGLLPILTFLGCGALVFWGLERQGQQPNGVGEIEAVRVDVAVPIDGLLAPLPRAPWKLLDTVHANEVVARLDDRSVQAKLAAMRAEAAHLRKQLEAEQAKLTIDEADRRIGHLREAARLAWQMERDRLDVLDRRATLTADRVELQRLNSRLELLTPLHKRGAVSDVEILDQRLLRDQVHQRIAENQKALADAEKQSGAAADRLNQFPAPELAEVKRLLAPFQAAVQVQEAIVRQIEVERELLEIRAPFAGTVVAIYMHPGRSARAGDLIMTIAAEQGRYIVGYVPQENRFRPEVGMAVELRSRLPASPIHEGMVDQVGPQVELIPEHHRRDARIMEWGQPVRILLPNGLDARPGELLDIRFAPARRS